MKHAPVSWTEQQGFLRTIAAAGEDNHPRLAYADWLEKNGGAVAAEFIRLQCALYDNTFPEQEDALRKREKQLKEIILGREIAELAEREPRRVVFDRGLIQSVDLIGTNITSLPDNLYVGGYLDLYGIGIAKLPDNLHVDGGLNLANTAITSLPDNLHVGGYLDLRGTRITKLPDNLHVGFRLDLQGTGITSIPGNLHVGGNLHLGGTAISGLPDNLCVGGDLDLQGTGITSLPDNLCVGGDLDLANTAISSLPENLHVGGNLYLEGTGIDRAGAEAILAMPSLSDAAKRTGLQSLGYHDTASRVATSAVERLRRDDSGPGVTGR